MWVDLFLLIHTIKTRLLLYQITKPHNPSHIHWHSIYFMTEKSFFFILHSSNEGRFKQPSLTDFTGKIASCQKMLDYHGRRVHIWLSLSYPNFINISSRLHPNKLKKKSRLNSSILKDSSRRMQIVTAPSRKCCTIPEGKSISFYPNFIVILS